MHCRRRINYTILLKIISTNSSPLHTIHYCSPLPCIHQLHPAHFTVSTNICPQHFITNSSSLHFITNTNPLHYITNASLTLPGTPDFIHQVHFTSFYPSTIASGGQVTFKSSRVTLLQLLVKVTRYF